MRAPARYSIRLQRVKVKAAAPRALRFADARVSVRARTPPSSIHLRPAHLEPYPKLKAPHRFAKGVARWLVGVHEPEGQAEAVRPAIKAQHETGRAVGVPDEAILWCPIHIACSR